VDILAEMDDYRFDTVRVGLTAIILLSAMPYLQSHDPSEHYMVVQLPYLVQFFFVLEPLELDYEDVGQRQ
jgi:hypothetical protein